MMKYLLRISSSEDKKALVTKILDIEPTSTKAFWQLELKDEAADFTNYFINILKGKYDELLEIGIDKKDITIWLLYEYDQQCNMEFSGEQMLLLGSNNITLCISCWQSPYDDDLKFIIS